MLLRPKPGDVLIDRDGKPFTVKVGIIDDDFKKILTVDGWKYYKLNFWHHQVSPNGERLHWFANLRDAEKFILITEYPRGLEQFTFTYNYTTYMDCHTETR